MYHHENVFGGPHNSEKKKNLLGFCRTKKLNKFKIFVNLISNYSVFIKTYSEYDNERV
jgi:hypothetical protein